DPLVEEELRAIASRLDAQGITSLAAQVASTGELLLIANVAEDERSRIGHPAFKEIAEKLRVHSFLVVPLQARGRFLGALTLTRYMESSDPFTESDLAFARNVSDQAALAISNAQLFESRERELRERKRFEEEAKTFVALVENSTEMIATASLDGRVL